MNDDEYRFPSPEEKDLFRDREERVWQREAEPWRDDVRLEAYARPRRKITNNGCTNILSRLPRRKVIKKGGKR